jgi:cellulose biosynthesis protein BcsQ
VDTIIFAASKGGTGKTTLAFNVGMEAAKHGSVYLADLDPQRSLT